MLLDNFNHLSYLKCKILSFGNLSYLLKLTAIIPNCSCFTILVANIVAKSLKNPQPSYFQRPTPSQVLYCPTPGCNDPRNEIALNECPVMERFHRQSISDLQIAVRGRLYEYEFSVLTTRFRFGGRNFSKCACSELKTRTRSRHRTPI